MAEHVCQPFVLSVSAANGRRADGVLLSRSPIGRAHAFNHGSDKPRRTRRARSPLAANGREGPEAQMAATIIRQVNSQ